MFAGGLVVEVCFEDAAKVDMHIPDGEIAGAGQVIGSITGNAIEILTLIHFSILLIMMEGKQLWLVFYILQ